MTSDLRNEVFLVVEDDPLLAATVRRRVERCRTSACVHVAETSREALDLWSALRPCLVLMDYRLPDGFGTDIVERMRSRGDRTPVVFMTAETEELDGGTCGRLSVTRVLRKPVEEDDLREALSQGNDALRDLNARRIGRFRRVRVRGVLTGSRVGRFVRAAGEESWIVLDAEGLDGITDEAARGLCAWAGCLSARGGRICVWPRSPEVGRLVEARVGPFVGLVADADQLEREGLRLTGSAERRGLLSGTFPAGRSRQEAEV